MNPIQTEAALATESYVDDELRVILGRRGGLPRMSRKDVIMRYYRETVIPAIESGAQDLIMLYFMESNYFIKIGVSHNPVRRLRDAEALNPCVELMGYVPATHDFERFLHGVYGGSRHRYEWFRLTPKMPQEITALVTDGLAYGIRKYGWTREGYMSDIQRFLGDEFLVPA